MSIGPFLEAAVGHHRHMLPPGQELEGRGHLVGLLHPRAPRPQSGDHDDVALPFPPKVLDDLDRLAGLGRAADGDEQVNVLQEQLDSERAQRQQAESKLAELERQVASAAAAGNESRMEFFA